MKRKERQKMCHRIIDESLTNEHTTKTFVFLFCLVVFFLFPIPPNPMRVSIEENNQSHLKGKKEEKSFERKAKSEEKTIITRTSMWHSTRKSVKLLLLLCSSSSSSSSSTLPVDGRSHFNRTMIIFDCKRHSDYLILCLCARMEQWPSH